MDHTEFKTPHMTLMSNNSQDVHNTALEATEPSSFCVPHNVLESFPVNADLPLTDSSTIDLLGALNSAVTSASISPWNSDTEDDPQLKSQNMNMSFTNEVILAMRKGETGEMLDSGSQAANGANEGDRHVLKYVVNSLTGHYTD